MAFEGLTHEEMRAALGELQQALFRHEQWCEDLVRTIICAQEPDERDVQEEAHRKCRFGQWLYAAGAARLGTHPSFAQIEASHELIHRYARALLQCSLARKPVALDDYERFSTALKQMRLEILTTKYELENALFNLDPLTGATSRIGMLTKLREQQSLVIRKVHSTCVAMLDLDHFKEVNDAYGHNAGDRVLADFARHVKSHIRPYDSFFRYGGEEFVLCVPDTDLERGMAIMEKIRSDLAVAEIVGEGHPPIKITVSAGLTLLDPDVPVEQSIERADKALYAAKASGRNRTMIWSPSPKG